MNEFIKAPPWKALVASQVGFDHLEAGLPCQDKACVITNGQLLLMAVADGAGTAPFGEVGARVAASRAIEHLEEYVREGTQRIGRRVLAGAVHAARQSVIAEAERRGCRPGDLQTTLMVIAATPHGIVVAHVGDGAVVAADESRTWFLISSPQHGACANETVFITNDEYETHLRLIVHFVRPLTIVAFSDGMECVALDRMTPFAPFLDSIVPWLAEPEEGLCKLQSFLESDLIRSRTADDCTLAIASLEEGQA